MAQPAMDNVTPIRIGIPILAQNREDDAKTVIGAKMIRTFSAKAHELAQTKPNSPTHLEMLHAAASVTRNLPRNKLRLIVTPLGPQRDWLTEAIKRAEVAIAASGHVESQWSLAYHLDQQDGGDRASELNSERTRARRLADQAIEDALRMPITRKWDIKRKQELAGREAWARKYRPDWQALIDADAASYAKPRKAKGAEA
jgi:hypothetical protein